METGTAKKFDFSTYLINGIAIFCTVHLSWLFVFQNGGGNLMKSAYFAHSYILSLCLIPLYFIIYQFSQKSKLTLPDKVKNICKTNFTIFLIAVFSLGFFNKTEVIYQFPRSFITAFLLLNTTLEFALRNLFYKLLSRAKAGSRLLP